MLGLKGDKMLDFLRKRKEEVQVIRSKTPRHVAITLEGDLEWSKKFNIGPEETYKKRYVNVKNIINTAIKLNIPIVTFYLLRKDEEKGDEFSVHLDEMQRFFEKLVKDEAIHKNKVKLFALGKWYDLPDRVVTAIKNSIEETKDYDRFFVNFCVNYDGQEEIVDSCKIVGHLIKNGKIDPEVIDKDVVKDNLYSSYFLPPELVIISGKQHKINGFLLWDIVHSNIYFSEVYWPDFGRKDFLKGIAFYQRFV